MENTNKGAGNGLLLEIQWWVGDSGFLQDSPLQFNSRNFVSVFLTRLSSTSDHISHQFSNYIIFWRISQWIIGTTTSQAGSIKTNQQ
jgi:hypothetical protein